MNTVKEEEFNTVLGKQLMVLRMKQKMSMDHLGMHLGVSGQQIYKYETGISRMPPEKIKQCCYIFNVPVDYFFGDIETAISFDKSILTIAAELNELPSDIRKVVYNLGKVINKNLNQTELDDLQSRNHTNKTA